MSDNVGHKWFQYYWIFFKHFGAECYRTWRWELSASIVVSIVFYWITKSEDALAWNNLRNVIIASAITLGAFALWHVVRAPFLAHRTLAGQIEFLQDRWYFGVLGILIMAGLLTGGFELLSHFYTVHANVVVMKTPTPPAPQIVVPLVQQESPNSLRRRTLKLVQDLVAFWNERPVPQQPVQTPSTDEERKVKAAFERYWNEATSAYMSENFKRRILGIVREYKQKGLQTGFLEQSVDQPDRLIGAGAFGGFNLENCLTYTSELCVLRELAYHVDAYDQPIFLTVRPQKQATKPRPLP